MRVGEWQKKESRIHSERGGYIGKQTFINKDRVIAGGAQDTKRERERYWEKCEFKCVER